MKKRIFLIILDSFGIGAAPDAENFGDEGANTLNSVKESGELRIPEMISLGLGNIDGVTAVEKCVTPAASYGRMQEVSLGKDTTIGHWEIAGIKSVSPLPTYPNGFPEEIIKEFERLTERGTLCNLPYSGTEVIKDYGAEHERTGKLIVYTSADSVFQIAAHEDLVSPEKLYEYCRAARRILTGEHSVGRVIARPFVTEGDSYKRTGNRRDFSLTPPKKTLLDAIKKSGLDVIAVGKINDIFAGEGITDAIPTHSNREGMEAADLLISRDFSGLAFINLVDFDSAYGHRQDRVGYARALSEFDSWLKGFIAKLRHDDALIITADHGCDPGDNSTDHTREYVPLLVYSSDAKPKNLGTLLGFGSVAKIISNALGVDFTPDAYEDTDKDLL